MRRLVTMLLCGLLAVVQLSAQTRTLKGKVTDDKGAAVSNASVTVKGATNGTVSDASGNFSLNVASSDKALVIRVLGFATHEVAITSSNFYSVSLRTAIENLDEVVVTGYSREKKSQFTGAANKIDTKGIETVPVGSFDQAFQGRAPGMLVNSGSGQPGASASITIRGVQSITGAGSQPLYVLDGVPLPSGDFKTLNPNDFESITVLKDASSAGIYGARGASGVIVITTKRGKSGAARFQYRTQFGFTQRPSFDRLNLMSTAEMLQYEEREKFAGNPGWVYSPLNPAIPAGYTAAMKQKSLDSIKNINTDFADILYRQGLTQSHDLNMSGGDEKTRYYLSGSYMNQQGIDLGSSLTRYVTRLNIEHTENKLTVGLNATIGYSHSNLAEGEWLGNSARNPFQMTYRAKPYENPYKPDGSLNFGASSNLSLKAVANLLEGIQNTSRIQNQIKVNSNINLAYKILSNLTFRNVFGIDVSSEYQQRSINANSYVGSLQTYLSGLDMEGSNVVSNLINTSSLVYSQRFGSVHDLEVAGYFEAIRNYSRGMGFYLYNLDGRLNQTGQGAGPLTGNTQQFANSAKGGYGIRSFFGTARYTYDGKYTFNGTIRRDGTSRIVNADAKEITTWSAGFTWNAMQENFMKRQDFLSDLKFRLSYGIVPNIGSITFNSYSIGGGLFGIPNYTGAQLPLFGSTTYAGSPISAQAPTSVGNPNLKIETVQKTNIGVDFAIWNNRARFSVDAYSNRTIDLFVSQGLPPDAGLNGGTIPINAGIMTNKGFEFVANVDVVKSRNFGVTVGWNHSINKNNIESLGGVPEYFVGTFQIREGLAYGSHYGYNYLGADPTNGAPRYETQDGKVTTDVSKAGQFAKFGSYLPNQIGGFTLDLRFKAITVSALFSYQFDVVRSDNTRNWITRGTSGYQGTVRGSRELLTEQWEKAGDVKLFQASPYDRGFTSSDLANAKFLRFRNLNVAYAIPQIKTAGGTVLIKSARFYVQAQNLAIWSPWKGLDPEDNNNISLNEYPNPKAFVVGLDINF